MNEVALPSRYELLSSLGRGGGGEVWAVRDRASGRTLAVKVLRAVAGTDETDALLREITTLSGLEGYGFPRVVDVGRTPEGRLYLVRELVDGESLASLAETNPERAVAALVGLSDALTVVHRTGLLHGDVKPENALVRSTGEVALVDLGLSTALREGGDRSVGFTPHFAPPEVLSGGALTVQGEVYSLGVILRDLLERSHFSDAIRDQLARVAGRATETAVESRFPSADEFGAAVSVALDSDAPRGFQTVVPWPVLGVDELAHRLVRRLESVEPGGELLVSAPPGAGTSTLLRRVTWGLGLRGVSALLVDDTLAGYSGFEELVGEFGDRPLVLVLDRLASPERQRELRKRLAGPSRRLVVAMAEGVDGADVFVIPPLEEAGARRLLRGALPGLSPALVPLVLRETGARPGALREFVRLAGDAPLVNEEDLRGALSNPDEAARPPLERAEGWLDRGHYARAKAILDDQGSATSRAKWLLARYELAAGTAQRAFELCEEALADATLDGDLYERLTVTHARALLGLGRYEEALAALAGVEELGPAQRSEGLAYRGLAESLLGRPGEAVATLRLAHDLADKLDDARLVALTGSSLATAEWRNNEHGLAIRSYERAIAAATRAGDSGMLASAQVNLAGLQKERGDLAAAIELLERAIDAARRAGRTASVQQALLNLTNLDLYLGRLARAEAEIRQIGSPETLSPVLRAQLYGLEAELSGRRGEFERADTQYAACERAWKELGRRRDAAEAALEAVLVLGAARARGGSDSVPAVSELSRRVARAKELLADDRIPILPLAESRLAELSDDGERAEALAAEAEQLARRLGLKEWIWRSLVVSSEIHERAGKSARAARARAEALEVLEEIAARLPPDLRAVYFSDPRRARLRSVDGHGQEIRRASTPPERSSESSPLGTDAVSRMSQTPLERRLAKILAVNSDLAGEFDLDRLAEKIVGHAAELLGTERAYLLLGRTPEDLTIRASRLGQGAEHREFSRSIAARVLGSREPLVSIDAGRDQRLRGFESVHLAYVSAVACVPVLAPSGDAIGALYLETRRGVRPDFSAELPTLLAFADQAAIALENSRLLEELTRKTALLDDQNRKLAEAQARLRDLLGRQSARLREVRQELRSTKDRFLAPSSFRGLVGESPAMRRVYALIERVQETDVPVLITGESGTGKEVVARAIHDGSLRKTGKMLAVNCGAIPETILESELFGHVRGAFTGADRERKGLFLEASGGTLFLDEIGETPLKMQAGLLRVLQERRVRRVGGAGEEPVDVRVIFATNRDLAEAVGRGAFREDLLYRIQVVTIELPPLRERREDVPLLCDHFLARFSARFAQERKTLSRAALERLLAHPLPGNVRQLENVLLNAWVMSEGGVIEAEDVALPESKSDRRASAPHEPARAASSHHRAPKRGTLSEHQKNERDQIVRALEKTGWNRVKAAEFLNMPRRTFYRRLAEYGIQ